MGLVLNTDPEAPRIRVENNTLQRETKIKIGVNPCPNFVFDYQYLTLHQTQLERKLEKVTFTSSRVSSITFEPHNIE